MRGAERAVGASWVGSSGLGWPGGGAAATTGAGAEGEVVGDEARPAEGGINMERPRRPPRAYDVFLRHAFNEVRSQAPDLSPVEIRRNVYRRWREMSDRERDEFRVQVEPDWRRYRDEMVRWKENMHELDESQVKDGNPVWVRSGLDLFYTREYPKEFARIKAAGTAASFGAIGGETIRVIQQRWREMNEFQRQAYKDEVEADRQAVARLAARRIQEQRRAQGIEEEIPKRPKSTAYGLFISRAFAKIKVKIGGENMHALAKQWREMSDLDKGEYRKEVEAEWERYRRELIEQKEKVDARRRDEVVGIGHPNAFAAFWRASCDKLVEQYPHLSRSELLRRARESWRSMDVEERAPFMDVALKRRIGTIGAISKGVKQPVSAFLHFFKSERTKMLAENPATSTTDIETTQLISNRWRGLSSSAKEAYGQAAREEWESHRDRLLRRRKRFGVKLDRELQLPRRPTSPGNAYMTYVRRATPRLKSMHPDAKPARILQLAAEEWNLMDGNAREPYHEIFERKRNQYYVALEKYFLEVALSQRK